jgi:hypothetical protein
MKVRATSNLLGAPPLGCSNRKKPLTGRAKCVMRPGQEQKSQSLEWEETKPELISNIQANLGGCRGGSERVIWRRFAAGQFLYPVVTLTGPMANFPSMSL